MRVTADHFEKIVTASSIFPKTLLLICSREIEKLLQDAIEMSCLLEERKMPRVLEHLHRWIFRQDRACSGIDYCSPIQAPVARHNLRYDFVRTSD
jgi:hypothetical protein